MRYSLLLATAAAAALLGAPAALAQTATPGVRPMQAVPPQPAMPAPMPQANAAAAPAAVPAPAAAATPAPANNVIDVLQAHGNFTTLLAALDSAHLTDTLKTHAAVSIFAPTDAAFAAMSEAERTRLMDPANAQELRRLLLYHVVVADVEDAQLRGHAGPVETAAGARIQLNGAGAELMADNATIGERLDASNGAVFAIDHVLTPAPVPAPTAAAVAPPAATATATATPPAPGQTAPDGQPAATNTRVAAPPVPNPTDGQVDPARPTPPIQTPDPADGSANGTEPNPATSPAPVPPTPQG